MPDETFAEYEKMKTFLSFGDKEAAALQSLKPLFEQHGGGITDRFYEVLGQNEATASLIEGRVDALKAIHGVWMMELFSGDYGRGYFDRRERIGQAHVRINLPPEFVEGVMSFIRAEGVALINANVPEADRELAISALIKILDLDLIVINLAYSEERIDRITRLTGMRRRLIENIIRASKK